MDRLVIITRKFTKEFKIPTTEISIGRSLENTLCLNDETISRCHAKIYKKDGQYRILDLGSYNGTIINGEKVKSNTESMLAHDDQIVIGDYQLVCKFDSLSEDQDSSLTEDLGFDLDAISGDEIPAAQDLDFDLGDLTGDDPSPMDPQEFPDTKKTMRYKAVPESKTTAEEVAFDSPNPYAQNTDQEIRKIVDSHSRATRRMPVFQESQELPDMESANLPPREISELDASLVVDFDGQETRYPLSFPMIAIGRGKENDLVLAHFSVSKFHSEIRFENGEFVLYDLNTTNGTMVNDSLIQRCILANEDTLNFGQVYAVFDCQAFPRHESQFKHPFSEEEICQMLVLFKVISKHQIKKAIQESRGQGKSLKQTLLSKGLVNPIQWAQAKEALAIEGVVPSNKSKIILMGVLVSILLISIAVFVWVLLASATSSAKEEELYRQARTAFDDDQYQKVLKTIPLKMLKGVEKSQWKKKILLLHLKARYRLGKEFLKKGRSREALAHWKKVIELLSPQDELYTRAAEEMVWVYIEKGRKEKGERQLRIYEKGMELKKILDQVPRSYQQLVGEGARAYQKAGEKALLAKKFSLAKTIFKKILRLPLSSQKDLSARGKFSLQLTETLQKIENPTSPMAGERAKKKLHQLFRANQKNRFFSSTHPLYQWILRVK